MDRFYEELTPTQLGTLSAVLQGLNSHQVPRLLMIHEKVGGGQLLDDFDLSFLEETLLELRRSEHFDGSCREFNVLAAEMAELYRSIAQQASQNEHQRLH